MSVRGRRRKVSFEQCSNRNERTPDFYNAGTVGRCYLRRVLENGDANEGTVVPIQRTDVLVDIRIPDQRLVVVSSTDDAVVGRMVGKAKYASSVPSKSVAAPIGGDIEQTYGRVQRPADERFNKNRKIELESTDAVASRLRFLMIFMSRTSW
jgi:hypothetical protein